MKQTTKANTAHMRARLRDIAYLGGQRSEAATLRFLKDDAMLRFVCESGIRFVTTSAGSPAKFIAPLIDKASQPLPPSRSSSTLA